MSELAKGYEPQSVEDRIYSAWMEQGCFCADAASPKPAFSIVMPPPNVTGILTLGHVLNNTLQDIMARRARMMGFEVLWLPGTDHAGIATQTVVEKKLRKEEKKTRHDIGREKFLEQIWTWKEKHGGIIINQLKKLGCSADWSRERFTMDEDYSRGVLEVFVKLYERGHIYRGKRMVNWCPGSLTAISDEEVIPKSQKGFLYHMRYEVVEEPGTFLEIATTRPETLMGDTAVAVHPDDTRYQRFIGKHCWRPFPREQIIIVADDHIDPAFGTGVLKVTPAHDKADFEIGQRHKLPVIDVLFPNGKINCPEVPELHEMDRFEARKKAAEMLRERELLVKEEPYQNNVGYSERADVPIEPRLSEQWFLHYPKTDEALRVVREQLIKFYPSHWEKVYQHWIDNIQDWCISRQLWWGHRIPVWYKKSATGNPESEIKCQIESPGAGWEQDPDVLDTWFSSWLWAYGTMDELTRKKFYPTNVLVTGPDIIFLWVARMIFAGLEFLPSGSPKIEDNIPFKTVYFTGLIRDSQGRKMSKSLGNSPDPLDLIAKFGADGLRFGLMRMAPQGQDIRFDEKQIEEGRNFCNKLWNACRFRQMQGPIDPDANPYSHPLSSFANHALFQFEDTLTLVNSAYDEYQFNEVAARLYSYVWDQFCSRFIEAAKADFRDPSSPTRQGTLAAIDYILNRVLRMLHPYMPFMTEELWQVIGFSQTTIMQAPWPCYDKREADSMLAVRAENIYKAAELARSLRGEFQIPTNQKLTFQMHLTASLTDKEMEILQSLINAGELQMVQERPARVPMIITPLGDLFLPLDGIVDVEKEQVRLAKEMTKVQADYEREQAKLGNEQMLSRAPVEKIEEWKRLAGEAEAKLAKLKANLEALS
jgi:valyl-tRNA synthetase